MALVTKHVEQDERAFQQLFNHLARTFEEVRSPSWATLRTLHQRIDELNRGDLRYTGKGLGPGQPKKVMTPFKRQKKWQNSDAEEGDDLYFETKLKDWVRNHKVYLRWKCVQRDTGDGTVEDTVAFQYDPHNVRDLQGEDVVIIQMLSVPTRIQLRRIREEDTDRDAGTAVVPPQGRILPSVSAAASGDASAPRPKRKSPRRRSQRTRKPTKKQLAAENTVKKAGKAKPKDLPTTTTSGKGKAPANDAPAYDAPAGTTPRKRTRAETEDADGDEVDHLLRVLRRKIQPLNSGQIGDDSAVNLHQLLTLFARPVNEAGPSA